MGKSAESQLNLLRNTTAHNKGSRDSASIKSNREAKAGINPAAGLEEACSEAECCCWGD